MKSEPIEKEHPAEVQANYNTPPENTPILFSRGMLFRFVVYILLTAIGWQVCCVLIPEKQHSQGWSNWDISFAACGFGGMISLLMGEWGALRKKYMVAWLQGMLIRGAMPVLVLIWGRVNHTDWESRGIFVCFGIAYLLTLSVETVLSVYILKERYQKDPIHKL